MTIKISLIILKTVSIKGLIMRNNKRILYLLTVILLAICIGIFSSITPEEVMKVVSLLRLGPLGYIILFTILPVIFFPVPILALAGGMLFGLGWGSIYTFIGAILNCSLMYLMAKVLGRERVQSYLKKKLPEKWYNKILQANSSRGFVLLIVLRLIPLVPYNLINYSFGLSPMKFLPYIIGSALGIIPGTLIFINLGDNVLSPGSPEFYISIILLVALIAIGFYASKAIQRGERTNHEK